LRNYEFVLNNFQKHFGDKDLSSITSEDILNFMPKISDGAKQNTKKLRFTLLSAFFNFVKNSIDFEFNNPCDNPAIRKLFRAGIFPITYAAARLVVKKAGDMLGIHIRPHDLRYPNPNKIQTFFVDD
jgi:hypothetical protein